MKVVFRYSQIYDAQLRAAWDNLPKKEGSYPSPEEIKRFMDELEKEWRKNEQRVFDSIVQASGLPWTVVEHACYVVGRSEPFSDPLTLPVFGPRAPIDYVADVLSHELIHRNLIQPEHATRVERALTAVRTAYPGESENVIIHVLVHAIHELVFKDVFSEERLQREKKIMSAHPDYKRAWEIVESVGASALIKKFLA